MKPPDILNSKIKKIRIELPHYSFSHSSAGDSPHAFIGRERTREKLKKIVEDSSDEPGVYLVAGNRGVGKTSLVSWVINETSLQPKSKFTENLKYAFFLFLAVAGIQFCLEKLDIPKTYPVIFKIVSSMISFLSFIWLCYTNDFRLKLNKKNIVLKILDGIKTAITELSYLLNPHNSYEKLQYALKIIFVVCFTQIISEIISCTFDEINNVDKIILAIIIFFIYLFIILICMYIRFFKDKWRKNKKGELTKIIQIFLYESILNPINNYIKNHNRLYLRINFGHKIKDEKDILRLIARTLDTEYNRYRRLIRRMLPWRIIALGFLFLFTFLFNQIINHHELVESWKHLEVIIYKTDSKVEKEIKTKVNYTNEIPSERTDVETNVDAKVDTKIYTNIGVLLNILDQLIKKIVPTIDYFYWLSFFLMYLCSKLLYYLAWITHLFVTHGKIIKQLKKLNSDITHSTELEKSVKINSEKNGSFVGIKTKKTRDIADAREIEKELQDIMNDIQRIPVIMCRPNIVIVFDELDKVEPTETGTEKENPQTKASLFSIDAARERQTEILRILSNMKYFLSTARAKFIVIAGREMYDIHLADVSERNNYIGSIFNASILVPSFLTDHHTGRETLPQESSIASLPEEFVCRRLFPQDYKVDAYNLKNYRIYLEKKIFKKIRDKKQKKEMIQKVIAVLQQFIIYLAHVSKGAPKKMIQLFESFIDISYGRDYEKNTLLVQYYQNSRHFLSFNYYKQYTIGIIAYLITPIFYRLAESNIKEHSDKLLVSSLRFIDFLFKFHKNAFSWKHLDMSPEMLEVNRAPELKSIAVDLLNYLTQVHINKSNFSLSEYKFDSLIANEIFAMAKTDEVFSALFSFSLDEMLPLRQHYQDLLDKTKKEYQREYHDNKNFATYIEYKYIDAISSLQVVLGDIYYYDDQLEEAEAYYKNAVQEVLRKGEMTLERLYAYVRNMLRLGIIYEKRKQYDFAYMTYGEICKQIINGRDIDNNNDMSIYKITYDGLKMFYLPFIAKLQILELSHMGGITRNYLEQLDKEFEYITYDIDHEEAKLLEAEFYSRVADILYYKNSDLKRKNKKGNRQKDNDEDKLYDYNKCTDISHENCSCTACYYYHKALSVILNKPDFDELKNKHDNKVMDLLRISSEKLYDKEKQFNDNYNMRFCTILARILSDWGNVFFSCDIKKIKENEEYDREKNKCYICDGEDYNSISNKSSNDLVYNCIKYLESENKIDKLNNKRDIAFAMYTISSEAYRKANLYKRSSYQLYKILCLFKDYEIYKSEESKEYIKQLSKMAIHYLWYANDDLNVIELNKRKKDFGREPIKKKVPLQSLLVDSEITRIRILVKELELKSNQTLSDLKKYYKIRITSPYKINYSIVGRIYRLRLKSKVNYEAYQRILEKSGIPKEESIKKYFIFKQEYYDNIIENEDCKEVIKEIFGENYEIIQILDSLIAESIYCLMDAAQLLETMEETYLFPHSFIGSIHEHLSFWIRQYEEFEKYYKDKKSHIDRYLKQYIDEEWREQLSGYRENQRALSHYYKCLEMHNEGRAYHNMIDLMVYLKDEYNDRSDHFNIAEERHLIVNGEIENKINAIKNIYKDSKLYKVNKYYKV